MYQKNFLRFTLFLIFFNRLPSFIELNVVIFFLHFHRNSSLNFFCVYSDIIGIFHNRTTNTFIKKKFWKSFRVKIWIVKDKKFVSHSYLEFCVTWDSIVDRIFGVCQVLIFLTAVLFSALFFNLFSASLAYESFF